MTEAKFPVKTREFHNPHFDSTVWNDFVFRDDDIVISTYAKSGTTWMQQIVSQLLFSGDVRSEEHTSELQSHHDLVCRLLLEKKNTPPTPPPPPPPPTLSP